MSEPTLQAAGFLDNSTVNGEGLRSVLFLSGCHHKCKGCHNIEMQNYDYGDTILLSQILTRIKKNSPLIDGVTISGGEPLAQMEPLISLLEQIRALKLSIWLYTGFTYEEAIQLPYGKELLTLVDVLVDGRYDINLHDDNLKYRGSSNQRILRLTDGNIL